MNQLQFTKFGRLAAILVMIGLLVAPASIALAAPATSFTQTFHNATQDLGVMPVPCRGFLSDVVVTYNGVFHVTVNGAGDFWVTGTQTGTFVATPLDPTNPTFTGNFTAWFNQNINNKNGNSTSILVVKGTGSDGSTIQFHDVSHMGMSASGLFFSFDKPTCG